MNSLTITSYCQVTGSEIKLNGDAIYQEEGTGATAFLKAAYRHLGYSYPKFFKMDNLCKLAFLASEPLMEDGRTKEDYPETGIAIILQNSSSSLDTDEKHQESIADRRNYFPSPSVFVYTLPNIMVGEIAIRHRIKGENAVQITPVPDALLLYNTVSELFKNKRAACCLAGWIDVCHGKVSACFLRVEKSGIFISSGKMRESIIFEPSTIERLFKEAL
jgi:hypothetical protein